LRGRPSHTTVRTGPYTALSGRMFRHGDEACFGERLVAQRAVEGFGSAQAPRSFATRDRRVGHFLADPRASEFLEPSSSRFPVRPQHATQSSSDPAVQARQFVAFAEAEVAGPAPQGITVTVHSIAGQRRACYGFAWPGLRASLFPMFPIMSHSAATAAGGRSSRMTILRSIATSSGRLAGRRMSGSGHGV